jgi:hypothetical protein
MTDRKIKFKTLDNKITELIVPNNVNFTFIKILKNFLTFN